MDKQLGCLILGVAATVVIALVLRHEPESTAPSRQPDRTMYTPPSSVTTSPPSPSHGETVVKNGPWPCGSTKDALDEITKWAVRNDEAEMKVVMIRTRSLLLEPGMRVKVLESGILRTKLRVVTNTTGQTTLHDEQGSFAADPRIGRECWAASEVVR